MQANHGARKIARLHCLIVVVVVVYMHTGIYNITVNITLDRESSALHLDYVMRRCLFAVYIYIYICPTGAPPDPIHETASRLQLAAFYTNIYILYIVRTY